MGAQSSLIEKECDLIIVGKTGTGKSSLGNSLLCRAGSGERAFESGCSAESITNECKRRKSNLKDGTLLTIVDTPGLFDIKIPNEKAMQAVVKCIALCTPGPHVILCVLSLKRITQEEIDTIRTMKRLFGKEAMKYFIVVFTGKDDLDDAKDNDAVKTVADFVEKSPTYLQEFLKDCNMRFVGIANRPYSPTHNSDVRDVMKLIYKTMEQNGNKVYSKEVFKNAEQKMQEEIQRIKPNTSNTENEIREAILKSIESNDACLLMQVLIKQLQSAIDNAFIDSQVS